MNFALITFLVGLTLTFAGGICLFIASVSGPKLPPPKISNGAEVSTMIVMQEFQCPDCKMDFWPMANGRQQFFKCKCPREWSMTLVYGKQGEIVKASAYRMR